MYANKNKCDDICNVVLPLKFSFLYWPIKDIGLLKFSWKDMTIILLLVASSLKNGISR